MSADSDEVRVALADYPTFGLTWGYDDSDDPSQVTVFPADEGPSIVTQWITIDVEHAVPVDEWR